MWHLNCHCSQKGLGEVRWWGFAHTHDQAPGTLQPQLSSYQPTADQMVLSDRSPSSSAHKMTASHTAFNFRPPTISIILYPSSLACLMAPHTLSALQFLPTSSPHLSQGSSTALPAPRHLWPPPPCSAGLGCPLASGECAPSPRDGAGMSSVFSPGPGLGWWRGAVETPELAMGLTMFRSPFPVSSCQLLSPWLGKGSGHVWSHSCPTPGMLSDAENIIRASKSANDSTLGCWQAHTRRPLSPATARPRLPAKSVAWPCPALPADSAGLAGGHDIKKIEKKEKKLKKGLRKRYFVPASAVHSLMRAGASKPTTPWLGRPEPVWKQVWGLLPHCFILSRFGKARKCKQSHMWWVWLSQTKLSLSGAT